jgi:hypothetical protein
MRHPFDGVNPPAGEDKTEGLTRRGALGQMAAAAAGLLGAAAVAQGQVVTTLALGEEGAMTNALSEAGGAGRGVTTEPFGEEAGKVMSRPAPGLEDAAKPMPPTKEKGEDAGPPTGALNEGGVTTRALGEEGAMTRRRGEDGGPIGPVVPVAPNTTDLNDKQLESTWKDMADKDAAKGVQACAILYGAKNAVPFLKERLTLKAMKLPEADAKTVAKLIADLDDDEFATRDKASMELAKLGTTVEAALEAALKTAKSNEQRMRLERLLEKLKDVSVLTQARRGVEVLVALKSKEAKEVLENLAKGTEGDWLTQAAKGALERMSK